MLWFSRRQAQAVLRGWRGLPGTASGVRRLVYFGFFHQVPPF